MHNLSQISLHDKNCGISIFDNGEIIIVLSGPLCFASFTTYWRSSAAKTNSKGDSGFPCLTPLLHLKCFPGTPFKSIDEKPEEKILVIHYSHLSGKTNCFMIWIITLCSMVSKALAKSSVRIMISLLL